MLLNTRKTAEKWFQDNNVPLIEWPTQTLDLNAIETLWAVVKKNVFDKQ